MTRADEDHRGRGELHVMPPQNRSARPLFSDQPVALRLEELLQNEHEVLKNGLFVKSR